MAWSLIFFEQSFENSTHFNKEKIPNLLIFTAFGQGSSSGIKGDFKVFILQTQYCKSEKKSRLQGTEMRSKSHMLSCWIYTTETLLIILDTINNITKLTFK